MTEKRNKRRLLVTSALPYANGDIHLGHLIETVQTDLFVRYHRSAGNEVYYVCADDTHGTPIQINAMKMNITPQKLIQDAWSNHVRDYKNFGISFDIFDSTNSEENRKWTEEIYAKLNEKGLINTKTIKQYYCEHDKRFLPDRFLKGTCPECGAENQYGDVCEKCNTTYDAAELVNPVCTMCGKTPVLKESEHFFVKLSDYQDFLYSFVRDRNILQDEVANSVKKWIDDGLREWCISRDEPYFGFEIPGSANKFFYVWMDAPTGYVSSTERLCKKKGMDFHEIWQEDDKFEVVHFIGKDIVYFHVLFWPVMLKAAELNLPSKLFVHGFLTVEGEKMSKSRGTFILAKDYIEKVKHPFASEYLRFYFGSKLSDNTYDIDLSIEEFVNKINTTLINNIGNFHNRTFIFLKRFFDNTIPDADWDEEIAEKVIEIGKDITECMEKADYRKAVELIHELGSAGNKYYQDTKPWELVKTDKKRAAAVMNTCANFSRSLAVFLKPFLPESVSKVETQFSDNLTWEKYRFGLKNYKLKDSEKLFKPIETKDFDDLLSQKRETEEGTIEISDVEKLDLKVGRIKEAEKIKKSKKLIKLKVDDGKRERQIVAGIAEHYSPEELQERQIVFIANLKSAKLMGEKSEGMLLAAQDKGKFSIISPDTDVAPGAEVS
ncbi:MAG: methionine--tRNA ligase [Chitinivibrionales bacterium]